MKNSLLLLLLLCFPFSHLIAQHKSFNMNDISGIRYKEISVTKADTISIFKNAIRLRELVINPIIQKKDIIRINDTILLDLFADRQYKAIVEKVTQDINGTIVVLAKLADCDYSYFMISTYNGESFLTVDIPEKKEMYLSGYDIKSKKSFLLQIDKSKQDILEGGPSLTPPGDNQQDNNSRKVKGDSLNMELSSDESVNSNNTSFETIPRNDQTTRDTITIMIVYTPAAAQWSKNNETNINNTISLLMAKSQLVLDNSNTLVTLKLVYTEMVNYTEYISSENDGDIYDLYALQEMNDGYMDNVHNLRNIYCADLVVLLENISTVGGRGFLLNSASGRPEYGFSLTRVQQASLGYTTIHELGHNMGCHHHKLQNNWPGPGLYSFSAGWRWTGTDNGKYCSVMTYNSGAYFADGITHTPVPYFSNPGLLYKGVATGDAANGDNARTIRLTKSVVSNYRSGCKNSPAAPSANNANNILQTSFTASWSSAPASTGYRLDVALDEGFLTKLSSYNDINVGNVLNTMVTGLQSGRNHYYRVRAYNTGGTSINSATITVRTLPYPPPAPSANTAAKVLQTGFIASWSASAGADGYSLDISTNSVFSTLVPSYNNLDVGNVTSFPVTGLNPFTTYFYRVKAYNLGGTSLPSGVITLKTLTIPSSAPTNLIASSCNDLLTLKWKKSSGPDFARYLIYGGTSNNPTTKIDSTKNGISDTSKVISGLTRGQQYNFRVSSVNFDGSESNYSNQSSEKIKTGFIPKIKSKWGDVLICYNLGDSVKNYQWYKGGVQISGGTSQYYKTGKKAGLYTVETIDLNGCKNSSVPLSISGTKSISAYPNPASFSIALKLNNDSEGNVVISLYSSLGKKVLEMQTKKTETELLKEIPLTSLPLGVYQVQVLINNEELYSTQIVVVK
jgi:hypothetical protein